LVLTIIEKSGGVAEGHHVGFLLYFGERLQGACKNIEKFGGVAEGHHVGILKNPENDRREFVGFLLYSGERL